MGWTNELYHVYELASADPGNSLLPISHSTANAQIELVIDETGCFKGAFRIEKENAVTIIPVTEDSGARSSGITPMPFADKLIYLAGDYSKYKDGKDSTAYYSAYIEQLNAWRLSRWSHPAVSAVYMYLKKGSLMEDLIKSSILNIDPATGTLLENSKISGIAQEDAFVRFVVQYNDLEREPNTWLDTSLYESFIAFNLSQMKNTGLCYATGKEGPVTYKHPSKIRNSGDKAKLISSNDESGFTYRGRFFDKEETLSVSYDFSQKVHNALKWLISKQGKNFGSLTIVTWASAFEKLPDELNSSIESEWDDEEIYDSLPAYKTKLANYIIGYRQQFKNDSKVMIMGIDAATTGRLSIAFYDELQGSAFFDNLENWHEETAWMRFDGKRKSSSVRSFSLYEIIQAAYGLERNGRLECDDDLYRDQILRLFPCVMLGKQIPEDLIYALYHKASKPLAYEKQYNHRMVIEVTCGIMRGFKKGDRPMGYDPNEMDRSYLYGCLLAIADKAESDTYSEEDKNKRITNARRYWENFAQKPYLTWQNIEERLRPYIDRHPYRVQVEKWIQEITDKFTPKEFVNNSRLDAMYLLGYHHFMSYMFNNNHKNKEEQ